MHAQSTILGTALLVSAAMAAPVAQITTTVTEPIAGWGGASISNTAINPQAGDFIPPFGGFGYNPYRSGQSWEGKYDGECSVFRRWRGQCTLDQPWGNYGNNWNNNDWYDRSVNLGQNADAAVTSETTISKRDTADASKTADASNTNDAAQWGPYGSVYGGWGYGGYRPYGYGYRSYNPYAYRYNPYSYRYGNYYGYGGYNGYPYYRATDEAAKDATAENANLEAAPAATEATTTVQNSKRDLEKRQFGPAWGPIGSPLYFQWLNWINTLRSGNVGTASFGGINPSFTVDSGLPSYGASYIPAYPGAQPVGFVPIPYAQPGVATGVGAAAVPGLVGTFSVDSNTKQ